MTWASLNVRMRLRENTQVYLDAELMALTAGIPGLEHHERPDYLDRIELLRAEREFLANPFNPISWSVAAIVQTAATMALLFAVHAALTLLPLCGVPGLLLTARFERAEADLRERQAESGRRARHLFALATEAPAAKEVRIFGLGDELLARRRQSFEALERERTGLGIRATSLTATSWLLFAAGYAAAGGFAAHLAASGRASLGAEVLVLNLGAQLDHRLADLAGYVSWLVRTNRAVRRLLWLMDHAAAERRRLTPVAPAPIPERLTEGIRFEGVSFSYPGTAATVLKDVNLQARAYR